MKRDDGIALFLEGREMPTFEQVSTEYTDGLIAGSLYTNRTRVIMRSPDAVLFVGYGINLWKPRSVNYSHCVTKIGWASKKATLQADKARAAIVEAFGEGADEMAIRAFGTRGLGTVLVDGGGEALPLPVAERREKTSNDHAEVSPTMEVDLTGLIATCRQCGANLRPHRTVHNLGHVIRDGHPKSLEDCQKMSNQRVVSVHGFDTRHRDKWEYVDYFFTWDGETLVDPHFCDDKCAAIYGRRAVAELPPLTAGGSPPPSERHEHSSVKHYDEEVQFVTAPDGRVFRI